jgi:hypothetical protein
MLLLLFVFPVSAETVIYENITTEGYKYITINDNMNLKYINDYSYDVVLNGYFLGSFAKGEKIYLPNNSNIIVSFKAPISSEVNQDIFTSVIKPTLLLALGFIFTWGLGILIVFLLIGKLYRDYIKRR